MSSYSVKKPITVLMGVLIIIVLGVFSLTKLPLTLFPDINLPYIVTISTYEGASPNEVEEEVTSKIESTVQTIGNFKEVSSMSNEHFGISIITFFEGTNMDTVVIELRELINNIAFVDGVGNTRILRISPDMLPVFTTSLFKSYSEDLTDEEILIRNTEWINNDVLSDLQSIPGVADVTISGQADVVLQINLDNDLLTAAGLTNAMVLEIIEEQNVGGLVGVAIDDGEIRMLYLGDKIRNLDEIKNLPIISDGNSITKLSDLSTENGIKYVNGNTDTYSKINGKQGIQISFQMQTNYSITEVSNNILERLNEIVDEDSSANYKVILNQGDYIESSIGTVINNLIIGAALAILILLLFLKDIKPTLIVGLAIPISVISSFMLMYFAGVSLNLVSMGGLALGIGMLVDNAIVVIENIYRMIGEGKSRKDAAIYGAKEVAGAITSSTLTTIAVFLPIVFVEGMVADVFMSMAYTIAFSLGSSLFIALTVVPSMASRMLNDKKQQKESKFSISLKNAVEKTIRFNLKHKLLVVLLVFALFIASAALVMSKGFIMLPTSDEGTISININMASNVEFNTKALYTDEVSEKILNLDDVETVSATINGGSMFGFIGMGGNSSDISITVNLKDNRKNSSSEYVDIISEEISKVDLGEYDNLTASDIIETEISAQNSVMSLGGASGVVIKVSGSDLETLEKISQDISDILRSNADLTKVDDGVSRGSDNVKVTINKENAMMYNLTATDINNNLGYFFSGLTDLTTTKTVTIRIDNVNYNIDVPTNQAGGADFSMLGDYAQFLSGIKLFDKNTQLLINDYMEDNPGGIYVPNYVLPTYSGEEIKFIINPYLRVIDNRIQMNPFSIEPTLDSLALAPLYDEGTNSLTTIDYITGFTTINTDGNSYYLNVTAKVNDDKNVTIVSSDVTKAVNDYINSDKFASYGRGYRIELQGENEDIMDAVSDLVIAGLVAILLVYMIMAIQFQSLLYPFIILITIPLAFTGGMLALLIANMQLSMVSIMGLIILVGVVVNNGIVLVDFINILRKTGMTISEAVVEAGKTRLRPILMTALTTILALLTMALGFGEGAELLQPMAVATIGGLVYATVLTVTIVPVIYSAFNRKKMKLEDVSNVINKE